MGRTTAEINFEMVRLDERIKEIELQDKLRSLILRNVRALYGPKCPSGSIFDIITTRVRKTCKDGITRDRITVQAIAYPTSNSSTQWKPLRKGSDGMPTPISALQEFLMDIERDAAKIIGEELVYKAETKAEKKSESLDEMYERLMHHREDEGGRYV